LRVVRKGTKKEREKGEDGGGEIFAEIVEKNGIWVRGF